jgi:hypothetical protein
MAPDVALELKLIIALKPISYQLMMACTIFALVLTVLKIYINIPFYFFYSRIYDYYFLLTQVMYRMVLLRCYHFITQFI